MIDPEELFKGQHHTCFSGGAKGADSIFGHCALRRKHDVYHWSFAEHHCAAGSMHQYTLSPNELLAADKHLNEANKILSRKFPTRSEYVNNLLRRNYYQIKWAERVYAVCELDKNGIPQGGTAWALAMAVQKEPLPIIYVFDVISQGWFYFNDDKGATKTSWGWQYIGRPFRPYGKYAGIGMSQITDEGAEEIYRLYELDTRAV